MSSTKLHIFSILQIYPLTHHYKNQRIPQELPLHKFHQTLKDKRPYPPQNHLQFWKSGLTTRMDFENIAKNFYSDFSKIYSPDQS